MKEIYCITLFDKTEKIFIHEVKECFTDCINFLNMFIKPKELNLKCVEYDGITTLLYYNGEYHTITIQVIKL